MTEEAFKTELAKITEKLADLDIACHFEVEPSSSAAQFVFRCGTFVTEGDPLSVVSFRALDALHAISYSVNEMINEMQKYRKENF